MSLIWPRQILEWDVGFKGKYYINNIVYEQLKNKERSLQFNVLGGLNFVIFKSVAILSVWHTSLVASSSSTCSAALGSKTALLTL